MEILLAGTYAVVVLSVLVQRLTMRRVLVYCGVGDHATGWPVPFTAAAERLVYRRDQYAQ